MHPLRALLVAALALTSGCNFIFNPDGDGILRCDNPDDCDAPLFDVLADNRSQSACGAGGAAAGDFTKSADNKVCSIVDKEDVSCDPADVGADTPFGVAHAEAEKQAGAYKSCLTLGLANGSAGCPPTSDGSCDAGLVARTYNVLTPDDTVEEREVCAPKGVNAIEPNSALVGFDVRDQHCRAYFCDESFVCNRSKGRCVRCDPDGIYGEGGCGELYFNGTPSTVYKDGECPDKSTDGSTYFGAVVMAPVGP